MKKFTLWNFVCALVLNIGVAYAQTDVLTQHNDLKRTGWNSQETILTTANVNTSNFGKLFFRAVDDQIYAQPLVVSGVNIPSAGSKNVVYVATVNNSIYAFDADASTVTTAYWHINLTPSGGFRPPNKSDMHPQLCGFSYNDFSGNFGIVGTPVIDKQNNILYIVSRYVSNTGIDQGPHTSSVTHKDVDTAYSSQGFFQLLHAIDIRTGAEMPNSPVQIAAQANGTGDGNFNGVIKFDPRRNNQRSGLVLSNGIVYIAYSSHCDWGNYHGWVLGYDAGSLQQRVVHITTPNDGRGGIWMSGAAPAVDDNGSLYFTTGNGHVGTAHPAGYPADNDQPDDAAHSPIDTANRGESVVKITPNTLNHNASSIKTTSFFTPSDYAFLNDADLDFPIQVLLIPNTTMALTGCKDNNLYLMNQGDLGGFHPASNNVLQSVSVGSNAGMHSSLAYFGGSTTQYVYQMSENTLLKAYPVGASSLGTAINSTITGPGGDGGFMSVSSNGTNASTAILWINQSIPGCNANQSVCSGLLRAMKAGDVTTELWNSNMNPADNLGNFGKMSCPTIANGKVYVATFSNYLAVYGPVPTLCSTTTNVALNKTATASSVETAGREAAKAFDGDSTTTRWSSNYTDNEYIQVDLGQQYDICKVVITWEAAYGKDFNIQSSNDGSSWTTVLSVLGNTALKDTIRNSFTGRYVRMQGITRGTGFGYSIYEFAVYGQASNTCAAPASLVSTPVTENSEALGWQAVSGATSYIIRYKTPIVSSWTTKTSATNSITLTALSCGADYSYEIQTVCAAGQSAVSAGSFTTTACSSPCPFSLPTRYAHADIGNIGVAGTTCYNPGTGIYTLKGSGTDIGSTADAFQFAFTNLAGDEYISAQVLSMDASSPSNKVGIMMRDSVSLTSPFAFIGLTSANGIVFEYRSVSGGSTTTVGLAGYNYPYWLKLAKTGTTYSAYISPDNVVWSQVGATVDLGFGSGSVYPGLAITSANNSVLSTATVGDFFESANPLPIKLLSFTASVVNHEYVSLQWSTAMEKNNDHFEVQRSADGIAFESIANVKAVGNSDITRYYTAEDPHPEYGLNFYRLKQVDIDNKFTYSAVVPVSFGKQAAPSVLPNPATSFFTVVAGDEVIKEITVYNVAGKIVKTSINNNGASSITITSDNLAAGIYIVQVRTATQVYRQKLFKQ